MNLTLLIIVVLCLFLFLSIISMDFTSLRLKKWSFGIFCIILAVSFLVSVFLPTKEMEKPASDTVLTKSRSYRADFDDLTNGNYENSDEFTVNGKWQFDYTGDILDVQLPSGGLFVCAQHKDVNDGIIEVISCVSPSTVADCDISSQIQPPQVNLSNNILSITEPADYTIEKASFTYDFTIQQFIKNGKKDHTIYTGTEALLIRLPNEVEFRDDSHILYSERY